MRNKNVFTFLIGAAAGALATWLVTTDEGKKMSKKIRTELEDLLQSKEETRSSHKTESDEQNT